MMIHGPGARGQHTAYYVPHRVYRQLSTAFFLSRLAGTCKRRSLPAAHLPLPTAFCRLPSILWIALAPLGGRRSFASASGRYGIHHSIIIILFVKSIIKIYVKQYDLLKKSHASGLDDFASEIR